jgi:DNA (cytosine-5)-methyltransferase 1
MEPFPSESFLKPLVLPENILARFGKRLRIIDPGDPAAYTTCFTSAYGKSIMRAGSYLKCGEGARYFSPEEIARLLHFPADFRFPEGVELRRRWHLLGNSLSVIAVRQVLGAFQGISQER